MTPLTKISGAATNPATSFLYKKFESRLFGCCFENQVQYNIFQKFVLRIVFQPTQFFVMIQKCFKVPKNVQNIKRRMILFSKTFSEKCLQNNCNQKVTFFQAVFGLKNWQGKKNEWEKLKNLIKRIKEKIKSLKLPWGLFW